MWDNLLAQSDVDFPFLTFEWLDCWWKSYSKGRELLVLLIKDKNEIIGIAPLMRTRIKFRGVSVNAVTFIANYHSNRSGFILLRRKEEAARTILSFLIKSNIRFDLLCLDFIVKDSDTDKALMTVTEEEKIKNFKKIGNVSPYIQINCNWEEYLSGRSKNFRNKLRNTNNRLDKYGCYELISYKDQRLSEGITDIFTVSENTWKFKAKTAIVSSNESINFYHAFAKLASIRGWLDILVLKLDNQPCAFVYNLNYKNKTYFLKIGYSENFSNLSPGFFVLSNSIKKSFEKSYVEFDLLGDNERYKMEWTSLCRTHYKYWAFKDTLRGKICFLVEKNITPCAKKIIESCKK